MPYVAIVLSQESHELCAQHARRLGLLPRPHRLLCHHVTLTMGDNKDGRFAIGEERHLTATHYGTINGRVAAFCVSGAHDSNNVVPHVTIATFNGAKPRESNDVRHWQALPEPFVIVGTVLACA